MSKPKQIHYMKDYIILEKSWYINKNKMVVQGVEFMGDFYAHKRDVSDDEYNSYLDRMELPYKRR